MAAFDPSAPPQPPQTVVYTGPGSYPMSPLYAAPVAMDPMASNPYASNVPLMYAQPPQTIIMQPQADPDFGAVPIMMTCPHCGVTASTSVQKEVGLGNWLACGGLALMGCVLGCCLIPFCMTELKDSAHYCASCGQSLGKKEVVNAFGKGNRR